VGGLLRILARDDRLVFYRDPTRVQETALACGSSLADASGFDDFHLMRSAAATRNVLAIV
jgi:hypothetical protein